MVASTKLPLIISLGIGFKDEHLNTLLNITSKYGNDLTLLHCNNAYPTPMKDANLNTIKKLLKMDMFKVGFSDHTKSVLTPALAVAAGAVVIEKHYTLSKRLPGPDHPFAVEPHELKQMIQNIKECELAMGIEKEEYSESEMEFIKGRRSVVAKTNINVGDTFTLDNITTKRPFLDGCIPASDFYEIIGKTSTETYQYDDFIRL
jgi:N,N'-diacetyllegionaminate synthase